MSYNSKYKGSEIDNALDSIGNKQDKIADLDSIRSGASKGATALQSIPSEYITESELNGKGYATTSAMNTALSGKQNNISDLSTIRSGAAKGATALLSVPSNYVTTTMLNEAIKEAITDTLAEKV